MMIVLPLCSEILWSFIVLSSYIFTLHIKVKRNRARHNFNSNIHRSSSNQFEDDLRSVEVWIFHHKVEFVTGVAKILILSWNFITKKTIIVSIQNGKKQPCGLKSLSLFSLKMKCITICFQLIELALFMKWYDFSMFNSLKLTVAWNAIINTIKDITGITLSAKENMCSINWTVYSSKIEFETIFHLVVKACQFSHHFSFVSCG